MNPYKGGFSIGNYSFWGHQPPTAETFAQIRYLIWGGFLGLKNARRRVSMSAPGMSNFSSIPALLGR